MNFYNDIENVFGTDFLEKIQERARYYFKCASQSYNPTAHEMLLMMVKMLKDENDDLKDQINAIDQKY